VIFSAGATIGAMITMYGAVANRTVEIGTLRALGFYRRSILVAFLGESLVVSFAGGLIGLGLASGLQFFTISTLNFGSFSELAFSFALSPSIIATALGFSLLMGLLGGFLPAVRTAPLDIIQAPRTVEFFVFYLSVNVHEPCQLLTSSRRCNLLQSSRISHNHTSVHKLTRAAQSTRCAIALLSYRQPLMHAISIKLLTPPTNGAKHEAPGLDYLFILALLSFGFFCFLSTRSRRAFVGTSSHLESLL